MFINGLRFFITKSCNILFTTSEHIINGNSKTLLASLKEVKKLYMQHGFKIRTILMDGQFECLHWDLSRMKINLSTCTYNTLVGEIERIILAIKESACGIFNTLPFTKLTGCIIVELLSFVLFWLNVLGESIASDLSLFTVMKGLTVSYKRHCVIKFCEYVQTHEYHDNKLQTRTIGAIALRPTGNYQRSHLFISLVTDKNSTRTTVPRSQCPKKSSTTYIDSHNAIPVDGVSATATATLFPMMPTIMTTTATSHTFRLKKMTRAPMRVWTSSLTMIPMMTMYLHQ